MGLIKRSDLIVPELLTEAIRSEFTGVKALLGTAAVVVNTSMPTHGPTGAKLKGGDKIKVPYFGNLGELDDIATEGDALTPATLSMSSEESSVQHSGKAVEITNWAQIAASYADPYGEVARQFREMVERRADKALLDAAIASLASGNIKDVYSSSVPKTLDYDTMVDAKLLWGDEQDEIVLLAVHSKVYGDLLKLKDSTGRPLLTEQTAADVSRFCGIPIKVSDRNTKSADSPAKYNSLLFKRGACAFWMQDGPSVKNDSDILSDSEVTALHLYWVAHRYSRTPGATKPGVIKIVSN